MRKNPPPKRRRDFHSVVFLLNGILQSLAGLESGDLGSGDGHSLLGLGVDAGTLSALLHLERAKANNLHLTVGDHALGDGGESGGNGDLPTGTVVECQDERSQHKNRERAMKILRSRLYEAELEKQNAAIAQERKQQVGSGDRSGKIRTYNFPQNRVTDHRLTGDNKNFNIATVMDGDLDNIIDALTTAEQAQRLQESGT